METSNTTHVIYDFLFWVTRAMHKKINKYENFTFFCLIMKYNNYGNY